MASSSVEGSHREHEEADTEELTLGTTVQSETTLSTSGTTSNQRSHSQSHLSHISEEDSDDVSWARDQRVTKKLLQKTVLKTKLLEAQTQLSQRESELEKLNSEFVEKFQDMEERANDAIHKKQLIIARLSSQVKIQEHEHERRLELMKKEQSVVMQKQQQIEDQNHNLMNQISSIKGNIQDLRLTELDYKHLSGLRPEQLSLKEFISIQVHKELRDLREEVSFLKTDKAHMQLDLDTCRHDYKQLEQDLQRSKQALNEMRVRYDRAAGEVTDVKMQVQQSDYKKDNYETVKAERDRLYQDFTEMTKELTYANIALKNATHDRDDLSGQLSTIKQTLDLLQQDKTYLAHQNAEVGSKANVLEERVESLSRQLEDVKQAREELYEKYVHSRDHYKSEYETRLTHELDQLRLKTEHEIDRVKASSREMYERENRNLRESRDQASAERDRAVSQVESLSSEVTTLKERLLQEASTRDTKAADLLSQVKMNSFELERTRLLYEESVKNFKESQLEVDRLAKRLELLTREYYDLENARDRKVHELEMRLEEKTKKLTCYEQLEEEMDKVVMQAAGSESDEQAERLLFSYGYGSSVTTSAKRRLQHSVQLARRVLQLEQANTSLRSELTKATEELKLRSTRLEESEDLLRTSKQPYAHILDNLRGKERTLTENQDEIAKLKEAIKDSEKEMLRLRNVNNKMAADLEILLAQKEEVSLMKQIVGGIHQNSEFVPGPITFVKGAGDSASHPQSKDPPPTIFTKKPAS